MRLAPVIAGQPVPGSRLLHGMAVELFRNKRQGKLSSKKAMEEASRWVSSSEMIVR
jgi:hypothetical protein